MGNGYALFTEAAARYDLHTPPHHYQDDYLFVLEELRRINPQARVLDVGCGTGVFLERAHAVGLKISGIDASPEMVAVAEKRLGPGAVRIERMQELEERELYDCIVSLSWSFHYCASPAEARDVVRRFLSALCPGGLLLLQAAHAPNATGRLMEDWEVGPTGEPNDVQVLYRFTALPGAWPRLRAQYVYSCRSLGELLAEDHVLNVADVHLVTEILRSAGFDEIRVFNSSVRLEVE